MITAKTAPKRMTQEDLKSYFLKGQKRPSDRKVGVEWEKLGVYADTGKAIGYEGSCGVKAIFKALIEGHGWKAVDEGKGVVIALEKGGSSITLEPGGQIELSGQTAKALDDNRDELFKHLEELKAVSKPLGIEWLGLGLQPVSSIEEIEWVPKERYKIMRESLKDKGRLTYAMMKQTASIQVSVDFVSEADAIEKLRIATGLAPFLTTLFANSPVSNTKPNGFLSKRADIWLHTAPERTGGIEGVLRPDFTLDDYVEYALDVPLLFLVRRGKWILVKDKTFREFFEDGYENLTATPDDWELHLSSIFTDARLKQYVEIRSMDCQKKETGLSAPALIKGIFYDREALNYAATLIKGMTESKRRDLILQGAKKGLKATWKSKKIGSVCADLVTLAANGLDRLTSEGLAKPNEKKYLEPIRKYLEKGQVPAESVLACLAKAKTPAERLESILCCGRI